MGQDTVSSYTGFRTVRREEVNGVQRILLVRLNTVPVPFWGNAVLRQAYEMRERVKLIGANLLTERQYDLPFWNSGSRCVRRIITQSVLVKRFPLHNL